MTLGRYVRAAYDSVVSCTRTPQRQDADEAWTPQQRPAPIFIRAPEADPPSLPDDREVNQGDVPLQHQGKTLTMVRDLLAQGCEVSALPKDDRGDPFLIGVLKDSRGPERCEILATFMQATDKTGRHVDLLQADANGNTLLHWAARTDDHQVITTLLRPLCRGDEGYTPQDLRAVLDARNVDGMTPLQVAMQSERRRLDIAFPLGQARLILAEMEGGGVHPESDLHLAVTLRDPLGRTAMQAALRVGQKDVVAFYRNIRWQLHEQEGQAMIDLNAGPSGSPETTD